MANPKKSLIIRDPIHGFIRLDHYPFIEEIVDTTYFQRLRRLSQLGFSVFVYPTATHNRFMHSMGVMHTFLRLFDQLSNYMPYEIDEIKHLRKLGTAVALLHDIGHGPFSHVSEGMLNFNHENITKEIIAKTEICNILKKDGIEASEVLDVLDRRSEGSKVLLSQLITSQLDVDRLDYLIRDAYFTGVGFGNIDLDRLINIMTVYGETGLLKDHAISLNKGQNAIEAYVLTRHLMYQGIYFHKTTRGVEILLKSIFDRVRILSTEKKMELPVELEFMKTNTEIHFDNIIPLDDYRIYSYIADWSRSKDPILQNLCNRVLNRKLLKSIEITSARFKKYVDKMRDFEKLLIGKEIDPQYFLKLDDYVESPYTPYQPKRSDDPTTVTTNIFVLGEDERPIEISILSDVVKALTTTQYSNRLYCPEETREDILKAFK